LIISRVKNRVREFLNTATSDTWFNFPEAFGITAHLSCGSIYGLHESLRSRRNQWLRNIRLGRPHRIVSSLLWGTFAGPPRDPHFPAIQPRSPLAQAFPRLSYSRGATGRLQSRWQVAHEQMVIALLSSAEGCPAAHLFLEGEKSGQGTDGDIAGTNTSSPADYKQVFSENRCCLPTGCRRQFTGYADRVGRGRRWHCYYPLVCSAGVPQSKSCDEPVDQSHRELEVLSD
jgi:hypothetical protein